MTKNDARIHAAIAIYAQYMAIHADPDKHPTSPVLQLSDVQLAYNAVQNATALTDRLYQEGLL